MQASPGSRHQRVVSSALTAGSDVSAPVNTNTNGSLSRKGSFSFLRRSKSRERAPSGTSTPARKLSKKDRYKMREQEMAQAQIPAVPPVVPMVPSQPDLPTFGGENARPEGSFPRGLGQRSSQDHMDHNMYRGMPIPPVPPIPPIPGHSSMNGVNGGSGAGFGHRSMPSADRYANTESMAHRGRYSYASSAISTINSPRKIRRRKDPTPFNILVLGARSSGKTSFLSLLRDSLTLPVSKQRQHNPEDDYGLPPSSRAFPNFTSQYVETEIDSERIGVTLWDSDGLETNVVDLQLKEITCFIESKFEDTYTEESKVARAPGFQDTHIHCVFLILDPSRLDANIAARIKANKINGAKAKANSFSPRKSEPSPSGLDDNLDLSVLRALKGKTTVIPVIAKADTITSAHMTHLKHAVWDSLKSNGLETLEAVENDDEDDSGSDTSREDNTIFNSYDERAEDKFTESLRPEKKQTGEEDKFSVSSHLDLDSESSGSEFSASEFDLAKPGRPSKRINPQKEPSATADVTAPENLFPAPPRSTPTLPLSIISPDPYEPAIKGRRFPWGFADPHNPEHCDFTRLKRTVFTEWRGDLREASRELWYEGWRTSRLNKKKRREGIASLSPVKAGFGGFHGR